MKKTRLMEISGKYGNSELAMNTSTIDSVVYMLCEMAEADFGPQFIDSVAADIELTQASYNRKKALEFLINELIHSHLIKEFFNINRREVAKDFNELQPLAEETYVDYFIRMTTLERYTQGTKLEKACATFPQMLAGYTTENPFPVCQSLVNYFKVLNDPEGLKKIIKGLCNKIKTEEEEWSC